MVDHEPFLVLGTREMHESLAANEADELREHLATCPSCRAQLVAMRRDDARIRALLTAEAVPERVHERVRAAAAGGRRMGGAMVLAAAAILATAAIAGTAVVGGLGPRPPASTSISPSGNPAATPGPSLSPSPSPSVSVLGSVNGAYAYSVKPGATRRESITAVLSPEPAGEWSQMNPATGGGATAGGSITCLVIDGSDAWMAGPATHVSDGSTDRSAFLYVHDGGPGGTGDMVVLWMNDPGQTLATMEGWCSSKFIPAGPYPVDEGDVAVVDRAN